jgi:hypothetical protein
MFEDEVQHEKELKKMHDSLSEEQLLAPVDPSIVEKAKEILQFSPDDALAAIVNLDEAYETSFSLEYSEINTVFEYLLDKSVFTEESKRFVLSDIDTHVRKLSDFSTRFGDKHLRRRISIED